MNPLQIHGLETDGVRRLHLRRACNNDVFLQLVGGARGRTHESYESILAQIKNVERKLVNAQAKLKKYKIKLIDFENTKQKIHAKYQEKLRTCNRKTLRRTYSAFPGEGIGGFLPLSKDSKCMKKVVAWEEQTMKRYNKLRKAVQVKIKMYNQKISDLQDQLSLWTAQKLHREVNRLSTRPRRDRRLLNIDESHVSNRFSKLGDRITPRDADAWSSHYDW